MRLPRRYRSLALLALIVMVAAVAPARSAPLRPSGEVIRLPPFLMEVERDSRVEWLYAKCEDLQVLSAADEDDTRLCG